LWVFDGELRLFFLKSRNILNLALLPNIEETPQFRGILVFGLARLKRNTQQRLQYVRWLRRQGAGLSPQTTGFDLRPVHVGRLVDKVALGMISCSASVFRFHNHSISPPYSSFTYLLLTLYDHKL
jgi:hypothetical protein